MILENTLSKGDTIIAEGKGRSSRQELKLLYLRDYFYKYTNRDTPKRMDAILKYLAANDIPASRVTICNDIEILRNTLHIPIKYSAKDYGYYVEKPQFESHEMLMLLDCIRFPTFITEDETERLRQKLMALASVYDSELVNNVAPGETHVLKAKVSVYDNLRILLDAIRKGRKISFVPLQYVADRLCSCPNPVFSDPHIFHLPIPQTYPLPPWHGECPAPASGTAFPHSIHPANTAPGSDGHNLPSYPPFLFALGCSTLLRLY